MVTHSAVVNHMCWMANEYPVSAEDRILARTAISFDAAGWEIWLPLTGGATICLASEQATVDPRQLVEFIGRNAVTVAQFVPALLAAALDLPAPAGAPLRVFSGGEVLRIGLAVEVSRRWNTPVINLYGPTETAIQVTSWLWRDDFSIGQTSVPIGRPIWNTQIYVLDGSLCPVPAAPRASYISRARALHGVILIGRT